MAWFSWHQIRRGSYCSKASQQLVRQIHEFAFRSRLIRRHTRENAPGLSCQNWPWTYSWGHESSSQSLMKSSPAMSRRHFIATVAAAVAAPQVLTAQKSERKLVIGEGAHRYEVLHHWPQLPDRFSWQTTHNVAIDRDGL